MYQSIKIGVKLLLIFLWIQPDTKYELKDRSTYRIND